jgi:hypothetical protein
MVPRSHTVRLWQCWDKNFKISKKSPFLGEKTMLKVGSFLLGGGWSGNAWNRHKTVSLAIYLRERKTTSVVAMHLGN